eukprot:scaffold3998_cov153-Skeletonema_dohrnii-CCMP3373.AAC.14
MMPSSKIGNYPDEDYSSVVSVHANPSTSLVVDDWRNDLDDKLLRNEMTMNIFKLLSKSNLRQRSSAQQWKASRLIEAAHHQVSLTRQEYSDTSNLKERVRALALAFHDDMDMEKQGNVTNAPSTR